MPGRHARTTRATAASHEDRDRPRLRGDEVEELLRYVTPRLPGGRELRLQDEGDAAQGAILARAAAHREAAQMLLDASVADNTRRAYETHIRAWAKWCEDTSVPALPASAVDVMRFLTTYAVHTGDADQLGTPALEQAHATSSVHVRAAALGKIHANAGWPSPLEDPAVKQLLTGVRRMFSVRAKHAKGAIDREMLGELVAAAVTPKLESSRRWSLVLLLARTSLDGPALRRLTWADVEFTCDGVALGSSEGGNGGFYPATGGPLCLASTLRSLREQTPHRGLVVAHPDGKGLSRQSLHQALRLAERHAGVPLPRARDAALLKAHAQLVSYGATKGLRDAALLTTGWWAALRRSEITGLTWGDLVRRSDGCWALTIRRSKTDQEGRGYILYLPRLPDADSTCPARAMDAWRAHLTAMLGRDPLHTAPRTPVFTSVDRHGRPATGPSAAMSGHAVNHAVQELAIRIGRTERDGSSEADGSGRLLWGAHSLRAGFVTEALRDNKLSLLQVQEVTRHKSLDVLARYRREIQSFESSPIHVMVSRLASSG